ncbi:hypothetical protein [Agromyces sp. NPDC049794]|uniref:ACT domain-containing protein n=1 Tax=unclassified Agromyces TaxID=2639701 RepID=UPI0033CE9261
MSRSTSYVLTLHCVDRPGIVATVSQAVFATGGGNIIDSAQYAHARSGTFTLRMEMELPSEQHSGFGEQLRNGLARSTR